MPYHMLLDHAGEISWASCDRTTRRGIVLLRRQGGAARDPVQDLLDEKILKKKIVAAARAQAPVAA